VVKYLSDGTLIATLYAVKWMFAVMSTRRERERYASDACTSFTMKGQGRMNRYIWGLMRSPSRVKGNKVIQWETNSDRRSEQVLVSSTVRS